MRLLRRALLLCGLLVGLGVFPHCAPDNLLILVTVKGLPTEAAQLQVDMQLNGMGPAQRLAVTSDLGQFAISQPNQSVQRGMLTINAVALNSNQYQVGSGTVIVDTSIDGPSYAADLTMSGLTGPTYKLSLTVMGQGTLTATGGASPLPCTSQCDYEVPGGTMVTLSAAPGAGQAVSSWSDACPGTTAQTCQLVIRSPAKAGVIFARPVCPAGTWCQINPPTQQNQLYGIGGTAPNDVWAVGAAPTGGKGTILHFTGTDWLPVDSTAMLTDLYGIFGFSASSSVAVGSDNNLYTWDGSQWKGSFINGLSDYRALWGTSYSLFWAVGRGGKIFRYMNGWTNQNVPTLTQDLYDVSGIDATHAWAVGAQGSIAAWNGTTWVDQSPTGPDFYSVWGSGTTNVWAVGAMGNAWHWQGSTWLNQSTTIMRNLRRVWGFDSANIWAVGDGGTILKLNGTQWVPQTSGTTNDLYGLWGLPDGSHIWAVGAGGIILHYQP